MSTAVDTAFDAITSSYEDDAGEPMHGACAVCYPSDQPIPEVVVAICGEHVRGGYRSPGNGTGQHKCGRCLTRHFWPCGHHS